MELIARLSAVGLLIILSPVYIIVSLGSIVFQGFPIFFNQERIGLNYQPFQLYKFRSMVISYNDKKISDSNDARITTWGKIIREMKLDELPQLWNIVKGDMRFIGPRPEISDYVQGNDFSFLEKIKPGLTDFSSIIFRNESVVLANAGGTEKYKQLLDVKVKLAHLYSIHRSFWLDIMLVILTIVSILFPQQAIILTQRLFINCHNPDLQHEIKSWLSH